MKQLVVKVSGKVPKIENAKVCTFEEEFEKYKKSCKKSYLWSEACFSWNFDSTLEDLKKSVFIYVSDPKTEAFIRKRYKVIEENEIN